MESASALTNVVAVKEEEVLLESEEVSSGAPATTAFDVPTRCAADHIVVLIGTMERYHRMFDVLVLKMLNTLDALTFSVKDEMDLILAGPPYSVRCMTGG